MSPKARSADKSLRDELLMELMDGEVPPRLKDRVEAQVASDSDLSRRYEDLKGLRGIMHMEDPHQSPDFEAAKDRVRLRLERSLDAAEHVDRKPSRFTIGNKVVEFGRNTVLRVPAAAAAALLVMLVGAVVLNFVPGLRSTDAADTSLAGMDLQNYTEMDPNFMDLLSVSQDDAATGFSAPEAGDQAPQTSAADSGISFQINVRDIEQLLRLLEGAQDINAELGEITIQLPGENQFQLLGESELRRVNPEEDR